jgi:spore cortex biosynthesis protein YabQ
VTLEIQALTMIHMVGAGAYLGAAFDTFTRLRIKKKNQVLMIIQDMLFWLLNGLLVFIWLKTVNEGEMRIYIFLSLLCGYAFYRALLQNIYQNILERLVRIIILFYRFIIKLCNIFLITPLLWIYKLSVIIILFCAGLVIEFARYLYKLILIMSRPVGSFFVAWWAKLWVEKDKESKNDEEDKHEVDNKNGTLVGTEKKGILSWMAKWLFRK